MIPTWVIPAAYAAAVAGYVAIRKLRRRRADREWAAAVAQRVHDRQYLNWLEREFARDKSNERRA